MTGPSDAFSLTRLFIVPPTTAADPALTQDLAGGLLTKWDAVSLANTVTVGPVTYRNLPVISPNGLTKGTVALIKSPAGYIILGNLGRASAVTFIDPIRYRVLRSDLNLPDTTFVNASVLNFLLNKDTQYGVDGSLFYNSTTSNDIKFAWTGPANMAVKWNMFGLSNAASNGIRTAVVTAYGDAAPQTIQGAGFMVQCRPGAWFTTTDTPGLLQLRVALDSGTTAGTLGQGSWLRISELGSGSGAQTYIKTYTATGSRSYDKNGTFIGSTDGDNKMYMGALSGRSFGNERHMWTFDGAAIRADLTGATVLNAQMFLYCTQSGSSLGDYNWFWSTTSTIQAAFPANGFGGGDQRNTWTPAGWAGFDISSTLTGIVSSGANSVLGGPASFSDSAATFYGYGFSASYRPYIVITYAL